jgi:DNA-binding beta-propeller fold protein YncE
MRTARKLLSCCVGLVVAATGITDSGAPAARVSMLFRSGSTVVNRVLEFQGNLLIVEDNNHRIVVTDRRGNIKRQIGSIGQGPGELYYPGDLVQAKNGNLYVFEVRNRRVQMFDQSGKSLAMFQVQPEPTGMAVDSKGRILLGQPANGNLVTVYSPEGHRISQFGDLRRFSDFYGPKAQPLDRFGREAINRIHIVCDDSDNIYVAFLGAPFWQKYSPDGQLLLEHRVDFPDAQRTITEFVSNFNAHSTVKFDEDRSAIPYITTGMTIDGAQTLVFSVRWDTSWMVSSNLDGTISRAFPLEEPKLQIRTLSADGEHHVFAIGAKPGHNNEIYSIEIPLEAQDLGTR